MFINAHSGMRILSDEELLRRIGEFEESPKIITE
jgi:hypothetical protein